MTTAPLPFAPALSPALPRQRSAPQPPCPWHLEPGQTRRLKGCAGRQLNVVQGRLWLTEPDDPADHFLHAGQTRVLFSDGPVVLENDGPETASYHLR